MSEYFGCNGLLEFLLGCSGLSRVSLFENNLLRLMIRLLGASVASRVSFGLQWPLEMVYLLKTRAVHLVLPCLSVVACFFN